jgi:hypothetical protein
MQRNGEDSLFTSGAIFQELWVIRLDQQQNQQSDQKRISDKDCIPTCESKNV